MTPTTVARLASLGVLRLQGPDTRRFLQGQLSNDLDRLDADRSLLAGLHNPQGRVIAVLRLFAAAEGDVLAALPAGLVPVVATRLGRFVLRAKVRIQIATDDYVVYGVQAGNQRDIRILPAGESPPSGDIVDESTWHAADIAAGLPQVYAATSEQFVAQMLNLDLVDGISFTKGCYTGQEIIARAHYRGRVKRRLQRFGTRNPSPLKPGDRYRLADGRVIDVIDAVPLADGGHELLAVAPLQATQASENGGVEPSGLLRLETQPLPLPYALED